MANAWIMAPTEIIKEDRLMQTFRPKVSATGAAKGAAKKAPRRSEEVIL